jgi:hypothetical protein
MAAVVPIRGGGEPPTVDLPKVSRMETMLLTPDILNSWILPDFQAPLRINAKVRQIADDLRTQNGIPVIPGIISLGYLLNCTTALYLYDGQHRRWCAFESGRTEFLADVRIKQFNTMDEMAREYLELNSPIARKTPDDQLRALQESSVALQLITRECPFIGYRDIRRNPDAPVVGMAATLRRWRGSGNETPSITGASGSATNVALGFTVEDAEQLIRFMQIAFKAWKKDIEYATLWSALNMLLCMWLWRVLVLDRDRTGSRRYAVLTADQFLHCLMAVSADADYVAWLSGRNAIERDRAPAYKRLRAIFISRLHGEMSGKIRMPQPLWVTT